MNRIPVTRYYDRRDGRLKEERVFGGKFLAWSYNSLLGKTAMEVCFSRRAFSLLYGRLQRRRWERMRMESFVRRAGVDLNDLARPVESYSSLSDFFTRTIDLGQRPLDPDPDACLAPCDGKILAYASVGANEMFLIKRNEFNLVRFLGDGSLAGRFAGGALVVSRLAMGDYHHFHFPASGTPLWTNTVPGRYHAGGSYRLSSPLPYFAENYRMTTLFDSDRFGAMILAEVGAMAVGSIKQDFGSGVPQPRGGHKGFFELGGSTVVLLFGPGRVELDQDLLRHTGAGVETYVRFGESIGRRAAAPRPSGSREQGEGGRP